MPNRDIFAAHNRKKLASLQESLTTQKWKAFCALPALLHYSIPSLPGGKDGLEPHGFIRAFFLPETMPAAAELFPELRGTVVPPRRNTFLGLYAMGSVGSVCFTSASDVDFWLIHPAKAISTLEREQLGTKLRAIENWAMQYAGLEIHFYIHDLGEIQKATFCYDEENAGEFGALLKDEFLRTYVYAAGLEPLAWGSTEPLAIDFGKIPHLTTEQYLSACLTQLEKALQKPFKSALKVALLRRLAARPNDKLPAEVYADRVESGMLPDSYMLLLDYLWEYFKSIKAEEDHEFLKTVLYLKMVAEETSQDRHRRNRDRLIAARFQAIGKPIEVEKLDQYFEWPFETRIRFSGLIAKYLQASLREISSYGGLGINPAKLRLLTRRIDLRGGSGPVIENLTFADVPSRGEPSISMLQNPDTQEWTLSLQRFVGRPIFALVKGIKTAPAAVPLIAFALKNRLLVKGKTEIRGWPTDLFPRKVPEICDALSRLFDFSASPDSLERPSAPDRHFIVFEQSNAKDLATRQLTVMTRTTWDVVEYRVFSGESGLSSMIAWILSVPPAKSGYEFLLDAATGPDSAETIAVLAGALAPKETRMFVLKDQQRYVLIRECAPFDMNSPENLLLEVGRRGGLFQFARVPTDECGKLISEIMTRARPRAEAVFEFDVVDKSGTVRAGFLLVDDQGKCDAWTCAKEDARYSLASNASYISRFSRGLPVECYRIERRPAGKDLWHFAQLPAANLTVDPASELCFKLVDGGFVAVRFGTRMIDRQAMASACSLVAQLIKAARKNNKYYPPFLTSVTYPPQIEERITIPEATRMKRELEGKIGRILASLYE